MNEKEMRLRINIEPEMDEAKEQKVLSQVSQIKEKYADAVKDVLNNDDNQSDEIVQARKNALNTIAQPGYEIEMAIKNLGRVFTGVTNEMSNQLRAAFSEPVNIFKNQMSFIADTYNKTKSWSNKTINEVTGAQAYATDYARRINQMADYMVQTHSGGGFSKKKIGSSDDLFFRHFDELRSAYITGVEEMQHKGTLPKTADAISGVISNPNHSQIYRNTLNRILGNLPENEVRAYTGFMTAAALPHYYTTDTEAKRAPYIKTPDMATPYGHLPASYRKLYTQARASRIKNVEMPLKEVTFVESEMFSKAYDDIFSEIQELAENDRTGIINELAIKSGLVSREGHKLTWRNRGSVPQIKHFAASLPVELEKLKTGSMQYKEDSLDTDRWNRRSVVVDRTIARMAELGVEPMLIKDVEQASTASYTGKESTMKAFGFPKSYIIPKTTIDETGNFVYNEPSEENIRVPKGQKAGVETKHQKFVTQSDSAMMRMLRLAATNLGYTVEDELGYYSDSKGNKFPLMTKIPLTELWEGAREANGWFPEEGYDAVNKATKTEAARIADVIDKSLKGNGPRYGTQSANKPYKFGFVNEEDIFFSPYELLKEIERLEDEAGVPHALEAGNASGLMGLPDRESLVKQLNNVHAFNTPSHSEEEYYSTRRGGTDRRTGVNPEYINWSALAKLYEMRTGKPMGKESILDSLAFVTPGGLFDEGFQGRGAGPVLKFAAVLGDLPKTIRESGLIPRLDNNGNIIGKTSGFGGAGHLLVPSAALDAQYNEQTDEYNKEAIDLFRYYYGDKEITTPKGKKIRMAQMDDQERKEFESRWLVDIAKDDKDNIIDIFFPDTAIKDKEGSKFLTEKQYRTQTINELLSKNYTREQAEQEYSRILGEKKSAGMVSNGFVRLYAPEFKRSMDTSIDVHGGIAAVREAGAFEVDKNYMPAVMAQSLNLPYSAYEESINNYEKRLAEWKDPGWVQRKGFAAMPEYQREMEKDPSFMNKNPGAIAYIQRQIAGIREHINKGDLALTTPGYSALAGMTTGMALDFLSELTGNKIDSNSEFAPLFKSALLDMYDYDKLIKEAKSDDEIAELEKRQAEIKETYNMIKDNKYFIAPGLKAGKAVSERYPAAYSTAVAGRNLYYNADGTVNTRIQKALQASGAAENVFYVPPEAMYKMNTGDFDGDTIWAYVSKADEWLKNVEDIDARTANAKMLLEERRKEQEETLSKAPKETLQGRTLGPEALRTSYLSTYSKEAMGLGSAVIRNALQMPEGPEKQAAILEGVTYYDLATSEIKKKGETNAKLGKAGFNALLIGQNFDRLMRNMYSFSNADEETQKDMVFPSIFKSNIGSINDTEAIGAILTNQITARNAGGAFGLRKKMSDFIKHNYDMGTDLGRAAEWYSRLRIGDLTGEHFVTSEDITEGYNWLTKIKAEQSKYGIGAQNVYDAQIRALETALKFMESDESTSQKNIDRIIRSETKDNGEMTDRAKMLTMMSSRQKPGSSSEIDKVLDEEKAKQLEQEEAVRKLQNDERYQAIVDTFEYNPNLPMGGKIGDKNWKPFKQKYSVTATEPWFDRDVLPRAGSRILQATREDISQGDYLMDGTLKTRRHPVNLLYSDGESSFGNVERRIEQEANEILGGTTSADIILGNYMHKAFENFWGKQLTAGKTQRQLSNEKNIAEGQTDEYLIKQEGYTRQEQESKAKQVQDEFAALLNGERSIGEGKTFAKEMASVGFEVVKNAENGLIQVKPIADYAKSTVETNALAEKALDINSKLKAMQDYSVNFPGGTDESYGSLGNLIRNLYGKGRNLRVVGYEGKIFGENGEEVFSEREDETTYTLPNSKKVITTHAKPDAVLEIGGQYYILDYKSSESGAKDSVFQSMLYQKQYEERAYEALKSGDLNNPFAQFGRLVEKTNENGETEQEFISKFGGVLGFNARGNAIIKFSNAHEDWQGKDLIDVLQSEYLNAIERKKEDLEIGHYAAGQAKLIRDRGDKELVKYAQDNGLLPFTLTEASQKVIDAQNDYNKRRNEEGYKPLSSAETDFYIARYAQDKQQLDEIEETLGKERSKLWKANNPYGYAYDRFNGVQEQINSLFGNDTLSHMIEIYKDSEDIQNDIRMQMTRRSNALSSLTDVRSAFAVEDVKEARRQIMSSIYGVNYEEGGQNLIGLWKQLNRAKGTKEGLLNDPDLYDAVNMKFKTENDVEIHPENYKNKVAKDIEKERAAKAKQAEEAYDEATKEYYDLLSFVDTVGVGEIVKKDKQKGLNQLREIIEKPTDVKSIDDLYKEKIDSLIGYVKQKDADIEQATKMAEQPGLDETRKSAAEQEALNAIEQRDEALKYLTNPHALVDIMNRKSGRYGTGNTQISKINNIYDTQKRNAELALAYTKEDAETLKNLGVSEEDLIKKGILKREIEKTEKYSPYDNEIVKLQNIKNRNTGEQDKLIDLIQQRVQYFSNAGLMTPLLPTRIDQYASEKILNPTRTNQYTYEKIASEQIAHDASIKYWDLWKEQNIKYAEDDERMQELSLMSAVGRGNQKDLHRLEMIQSLRSMREKAVERRDENGDYIYSEQERQRVRDMLSDPVIEGYVNEIQSRKEAESQLQLQINRRQTEAYLEGREFTREEKKEHRRDSMIQARNRTAAQIREEVGGKEGITAANEYLLAHSNDKIDEIVESQDKQNEKILEQQLQNREAATQMQIDEMLHKQELSREQFDRQQRRMHNRSRIAQGLYRLDDRVLNQKEAIRGYQNQNTSLINRNKLIEEQLKSGAIDEKTRKELTSEHKSNIDKINGNIKAIDNAKQEIKDLSTVGAKAQAVFSGIGDSVAMVATRFGRQMFRRAINEVKQFVQQYDKAMTDIQMITLKSDEQITELGSNLIEKAMGTGATVSEVTSVAANLYRQGLSDQEVDTRLEDVIKFSKVAGIKTEEASKIITTALQNGLVNTSEEAMDALVALGDTAATTATELSKGMQKSAAAAKDAKVNYGELVTLLTIGTSKTQLGGASVGTALNTLFYRMYKVGEGEDFIDENGVHVSSTAAQRALKRAGVGIYNKDGSFKGAYSVLTELGSKWSGLDDTTQSLILSQLGMGRQRNNIATLLQGLAEDNGELAKKYMETAGTSNGITDKKYENYMDSLQAKQNEVKTSFDQLVNSFGGDKAAGGLMDTASSFIQGLTAANQSSGGLVGTGLLGGVGLAGIAGLAMSHPYLLAATGIIGGITTAISGIGNLVKYNSEEERNKRELEAGQKKYDDYQTKNVTRAKELREQIDSTNELVASYNNLSEAEQEAADIQINSAIESISNSFSLSTQAIDENASAIDRWRTIADEAKNSANDLYEHTLKHSEDLNAPTYKDINERRKKAIKELDEEFAAVNNRPEVKPADIEFYNRNFSSAFWEENLAPTLLNGLIATGAKDARERLANLIGAEISSPNEMSESEYLNILKGSKWAEGEDLHPVLKDDSYMSVVLGTLLTDKGFIYDIYDDKYANERIMNEENAEKLKSPIRSLIKWVDEQGFFKNVDLTDYISDIGGIDKFIEQFNYGFQDTEPEIVNAFLSEIFNILNGDNTILESYTEEFQERYKKIYEDAVNEYINANTYGKESKNLDAFGHSAIQAAVQEAYNSGKYKSDDDFFSNLPNIITGYINDLDANPLAFLQRYGDIEKAPLKYRGKGYQNEEQIIAQIKKQYREMNPNEIGISADEYLAYELGRSKTENKNNFFQSIQTGADAYKAQDKYKPGYAADEIYKSIQNLTSFDDLINAYNRGEINNLAAFLQQDAPDISNWLNNYIEEYEENGETKWKLKEGANDYFGMFKSKVAAKSINFTNAEWMNMQAQAEAAQQTLAQYIAGARGAEIGDYATLSAIVNNKELMGKLEGGNATEADIAEIQHLINNYRAGISGYTSFEKAQGIGEVANAIKEGKFSELYAGRTSFIDQALSGLTNSSEYIAAVKALEETYGSVQAGLELNDNKGVLKSFGGIKGFQNLNKQFEELQKNSSINLEITGLETLEQAGELLQGTASNFKALSQGGTIELEVVTKIRTEAYQAGQQTAKLLSGNATQQAEAAMAILGMNEEQFYQNEAGNIQLAKDKETEDAIIKAASYAQERRAYDENASALRQAYRQGDITQQELRSRLQKASKGRTTYDELRAAEGYFWNTQTGAYEYNPSRLKVNYVSQEQLLKNERAQRAENNLTQYYRVIANGQVLSDEAANLLKGDEQYWNMVTAGAPKEAIRAYAARKATGQQGNFIDNYGWALNNLFGAGWQENAASFDFTKNRAWAQSFLTGPNADIYRDVISQIEGGDNLLKLLTGEEGNIEEGRQSLVTLVEQVALGAFKNAEEIVRNRTTLSTGNAADVLSLVSSFRSQLSSAQNAQYILQNRDLTNASALASYLGVEDVSSVIQAMQSGNTAELDAAMTQMQRDWLSNTASSFGIKGVDFQTTAMDTLIKELKEKASGLQDENKKTELLNLLAGFDENGNIIGLEDVTSRLDFSKVFTNQQAMSLARNALSSGLSYTELQKKYTQEEMAAMENYAPELARYLKMDENQRATLEGQNILRNIELQFKITGIQQLEEAGTLLEGTANLVEQLAKGGTFEINARLNLASENYDAAQIYEMSRNGSEAQREQAALSAIPGLTSARYRTNRELFDKQVLSKTDAEMNQRLKSLAVEYYNATDKQKFIEESLTPYGFKVSQQKEFMEVEPENKQLVNKIIYTGSDIVDETASIFNDSIIDSARLDMLNGLTDGEIDKKYGAGMAAQASQGGSTAFQQFIVGRTDPKRIVDAETKERARREAEESQRQHEKQERLSDLESRKRLSDEDARLYREEAFAQNNEGAIVAQKVFDRATTTQTAQEYLDWIKRIDVNKELQSSSEYQKFADMYLDKNGNVKENVTAEDLRNGLAQFTLYSQGFSSYDREDNVRLARRALAGNDKTNALGNEQLKNIIGDELYRQWESDELNRDARELIETRLQNYERGVSGFTAGQKTRYQNTIIDKIASGNLTDYIKAIGEDNAKEIMSNFSEWEDYSSLIRNKEAGLIEVGSEDEKKLQELQTRFEIFQRDSKIQLDIGGIEALEQAGELLDGTAAKIEKLQKGGRFEIEAVIDIKTEAHKQGQLDAILAGGGTKEELVNAIIQTTGASELEAYENTEALILEAQQKRAVQRRIETASLRKERAYSSDAEVIDKAALEQGLVWQGEDYVLPEGYSFKNGIVVDKNGRASYEETAKYRASGAYIYDQSKLKVDRIAEHTKATKKYSSAEINEMANKILNGANITDEGIDAELYNIAENQYSYLKEYRRRQRDNEAVGNYREYAKQEILAGKRNELAEELRAQYAGNKNVDTIVQAATTYTYGTEKEQAASTAQMENQLREIANAKYLLGGSTIDSAGAQLIASLTGNSEEYIKESFKKGNQQEFANKLSGVLADSLIPWLQGRGIDLSEVTNKAGMIGAMGAAGLEDAFISLFDSIIESIEETEDGLQIKTKEVQDKNLGDAYEVGLEQLRHEADSARITTWLKGNMGTIRDMVNGNYYNGSTKETYDAAGAIKALASQDESLRGLNIDNYFTPERTAMYQAFIDKNLSDDTFSALVSNDLYGTKLKHSQAEEVLRSYFSDYVNENGTLKTDAASLAGIQKIANELITGELVEGPEIIKALNGAYGLLPDTFYAIAMSAKNADEVLKRFNENVTEEQVKEALEYTEADKELAEALTNIGKGGTDTVSGFVQLTTLIDEQYNANTQAQKVLENINKYKTGKDIKDKTQRYYLKKIYKTDDNGLNAMSQGSLKLGAENYITKSSETASTYYTKLFESIRQQYGNIDVNRVSVGADNKIDLTEAIKDLDDDAKFAYQQLQDHVNQMTDEGEIRFNYDVLFTAAGYDVDLKSLTKDISEETRAKGDKLAKDLFDNLMELKEQGVDMSQFAFNADLTLTLPQENMTSSMKQIQKQWNDYAKDNPVQAYISLVQAGATATGAGQVALQGTQDLYNSYMKTLETVGIKGEQAQGIAGAALLNANGKTTTKGSRGGGGGGASKAQEAQKAMMRIQLENAELEHNRKMAQIEQEKYNRLNNSEGYIASVEKEKTALAEIIEAHRKHIDSLKSERSGLDSSTQEYSKLTEMIYQAEEALANYDNELASVNAKTLEFKLKQQEIADKPQGHEQTMLNTLANTALNNDRFNDYVYLKQQEIASMQNRRGQNLTQIEELKKELSNWKEGDDKYIEIRDKIWAMEEENAQLTADELTARDEIQQQKIARIAQTFQQNTQRSNYNMALADMYGNYYQENGNREEYKNALAEEKVFNQEMVAENQKARDSLQALLDSGEIEEGTTRWFEIQNAIYGYDEAIAKAAITQEQLNKAMRENEIAKITEKYQDLTMQTSHANDMLQAQAQEYLATNSYEEYNEVSNKIGQNNQSLISAKEQELTEYKAKYEKAKEAEDIPRLKALYNDEIRKHEDAKNKLQARLDSGEIDKNSEEWINTEKEINMHDHYIQDLGAERDKLDDRAAAEAMDANEQRSLLNTINTTEKDLQTLKIQEAQRKREQLQTNYDWMIENFDRDDSNIQHNKQLVQYQATKYQNADEWTNYGRALEENRNIDQTRRDLLIDQTKELREQIEGYKKELGEGSDLEIAATEQLKKKEEAIKSLDTELANYDKLLEENKEKIREQITALTESMVKEIEENRKHQREILSANVSTQEAVLEVMKKVYQHEWDLQKKTLEKEKENLAKEKELINERFNYRKKAAQQADTDEELAEYRRQLALLEADPTRTKEAKELRRKIQDMEKEQSWQIAEDELENENYRIDEQTEGIDKYINFNDEKTAEILSDANNFAAQLGEIFTGTYEEAYKKLVEYMHKYNEEMIKSLPEAQQNYLKGLEDTTKTMYDYIEPDYAQVAELLFESDGKGGYKTDSNGHYILKMTKQEYIDYMKNSDLEYRKHREYGNTTEMSQLEYQWSETYRKASSATKDDASFDSHDHSIKNNTNNISFSDIYKDSADITNKTLGTISYDVERIAKTIDKSYGEKYINNLYEGYGFKEMAAPPGEEGTTSSGEKQAVKSIGVKYNKETQKWYLAGVNPDTNEELVIDGGEYATKEDAIKAAAYRIKEGWMNIAVSNQRQAENYGLTDLDQELQRLEYVLGQEYEDFVKNMDLDKFNALINAAGGSVERIVSAIELAESIENDYVGPVSEGYTLSNWRLKGVNPNINTKPVGTPANIGGLDDVKNLNLNIDYNKLASKSVSDEDKKLRNQARKQGDRFASGGLVDYTGLAWVDGTPSKPEAFLSATDTANIRSLLNAFDYIRVSAGVHPTSDMMSSNTANFGDINVTINQAELKSDADIDKLAEKVGKAFSKELSKQGLTLAGYAM